MSYLLLAGGVLLALLAFAAVRRHPWIWVVAMAGAELAGWWLIASLLGVAVTANREGAVATAALVLFMASVVGFATALVRGYRAATVVAKATSRFTGATHRLRWSRIGAALFPLARDPRRVTEQCDLAYGPHPRHLLDRSGPDPAAGPRPALIYVHGGGWWRGRRHTQARPLRYRLAAAGWQVLTPSYRLSPEVTVPDHLIDVKRAIAWVRENAAALGVDPGFIAVAGGSTGGNLAALAALTAGEASLQPGFESVDTSLQACIPFYGVHDMLGSDGRPLWPYLEVSVVKASVAADPDRWRRSSPVHAVTARRPPFFVIHGAIDSLVRSEQSARLVAVMRAIGGAEAALLEVPWANHGFDFFAGPRGRATAAAAHAVLEHVHARYRVRVR